MKKIIQDVVFKKTRPPAVTPAKSTPKVNEAIPKTGLEPISPHTFLQKGVGASPDGRESNSKFVLWLVAVIAFIFLLFSVSVLFTSAKIVVLPKIKDLVVEQEITASKDAKNGILPFELMTIKDEETRILKATKQVDVEKKASGQVFIYNAFSTEPQKLLIETRLEGEGKIYKTDAPVIIPGSTVKDGEIVPGSIEVGITAAVPGEEYNSGPIDLTIFGFKGTPKYTKFYARSKGEISGGFKGLAYVIDEEEANGVSNDLQEILKSRMLARAKAEIPSDFVFFDGAAFFDFGDTKPKIEAKESDLPITEKAALTVVLFNREKLTSKILELTDKEKTGADFYIADLNNLNFTIKSPADLSLGEPKELVFSLSGRAKTVSKVDEDKLASDLLGIRKKEFRQVLANYPNIDQAEVTIKPFWRSTFPENLNKIKIIVKS
ncbi:hypothetical protein A3A09_01650 [Candidatus Nomurabacteria bacterium RIFCSPLOWO2_01_FULL_42_20]|uniref:Baseplate protein J-like domain-containing protein n=1 Tax=Candidatus Nomurabacteria bacterium RIFCSPHIGHO2_01_FULL_42_16 TaxID=1801743 RepID=A0A1F6VHP2_9BACT|nr:MAG: hypothetical protein A2824_01870 [Candidatus Nomurabacteria bacterium RIFCSPHIGHO2_01_FULL_42_16]OGI91246.1 MAG: hypothetical protein A3A09_01650 [Candidatus Nomurabacteria bacterium RIFCSPLOWO2_01_FULL_42_20]